MKETLRISFAMCTFNGDRFIQEQLEGIARQTILPTELVVCDDGSHDGTLEILARFAHSAPFPVGLVRYATRLGSTRNFEQAVRLCEGNLVALCDQDDWWREDKLEILTMVLRTSGAGGVFSNGLIVDDRSQPTGETLWGAIRFKDPAALGGPKREAAIDFIEKQPGNGGHSADTLPPARSADALPAGMGARQLDNMDAPAALSSCRLREQPNPVSHERFPTGRGGGPLIGGAAKTAARDGSAVL